MTVSRRETIAGLSTLALLSRGSYLRAAVARQRLSNPDASERSKALYRYLWEIYGRYTLTGQQESGGFKGQQAPELTEVKRDTGDFPAILGLDYLDPATHAAVNARAADWFLRGNGIPTICWHWGAPDRGPGLANARRDFDVSAALRAGTKQRNSMQRDLASIADLLTQLRDRDVPVLWRPFHEFSAGYFWWGRHGPQAFKALWRHMYDYFTNERGLNNLIWVLGYAGARIDAAYYPGRSYVDIAGADSYAKDHGNRAKMFGDVKKIVGNTVPICLHECGAIPDPQTLGKGANWLYFMAWNGRFLSRANSAATLDKYYRSPRYVTRNELPRLNG